MEISENDETVAEGIISRLHGVTKTAHGWQARCPAHEDKQPSLSVTLADGKVLVKCHRGCDFKEIAAALKLSQSAFFESPKSRNSAGTAITLSALAVSKGLPEEFLAQLGLTEISSGVKIPYLDTKSEECPRYRIRTALKAKDGSRWNKSEAPIEAYGLWRLAEARAASQLIIVEGESDCWTCWHHGFPALGIPGASMVKTLDLEAIQSIGKLYIVREPDAGGAAFIKNITNKLRQAKWPWQVFEVSLKGVKDPNDLHKKDPVAFKSTFQLALDEAVPIDLDSPAPKPAPSAPASAAHSGDVSYQVEGNQTFHIRYDREGNSRPVRLASFSAKIIEEISVDDGQEEARFLSIAGVKASGRPLPPVRVPVAKFAAMAWPLELWGVGAFIEPGQGAKEHLRAAIQTNSGDEILRRTIFKHTGWREVAGEWVYLHAGGAIGSDGALEGLEVSLPGVLSRYNLPAPPTGKDEVTAIRASLALLSVAPAKITYSLLAATYRAAMGATDLGVHVAGPTGSGKSEISALAQQHFGASMDARHLPGSWSSTGNALEGMAFSAKDALFTVDDFAPTGSQTDVQRFHRDADRLFRAQGNQSGRQRMNADSSIRPTKYPRGLILSSGEDIPKGQSLRARLLTLEMSSGDMDWNKLRVCQKDAAAGLYAQAMGGFIRSLSSNYAQLQQRLLDDRNRLAAAATLQTKHRRTPRIIADLAVGLQFMLAYANDAGAITEAEKEHLWCAGWEALGEAAALQSKYQDASDPAKRFLELIGSALSTGAAHLAAPDGGAPQDAAAWGWRLRVIGAGDAAREEWQHCGQRIGWIDGTDIYLDPEGSFGAAQEVGRKANDSLTITAQTLRKRLHEGRHLASMDTARETLKVRRVLEGRSHEVLHIDAGSISAREKPDIPDIDVLPAPTTPADPDINVGNDGLVETLSVEVTSDPEPAATASPTRRVWPD